MFCLSITSYIIILIHLMAFSLKERLCVINQILSVQHDTTARTSAAIRSSFFSSFPSLRWCDPSMNWSERWPSCSCRDAHGEPEVTHDVIIGVIIHHVQFRFDLLWWGQISWRRWGRRKTDRESTGARTQYWKINIKSILWCWVSISTVSHDEEESHVYNCM